MFYKHTPSLQLAFHPIKQSHFFSTLHRLRRRYATASVSQELNDKKKKKRREKKRKITAFLIQHRKKLWEKRKRQSNPNSHLMKHRYPLFWVPKQVMKCSGVDLVPLLSHCLALSGAETFACELSHKSPGRNEPS